MKTYLMPVFFFFNLTCLAQKAGEIDLTHWKLEVPSGFTASEWTLANFQEDEFLKPFFYLDPLDGTLVMKAFPVQGTSKAKYTKTSMREQMEPGSGATNWTFAQGASLKATFQVTEISKNENKYDRTLLFQLHGTTSKSQNEELSLSKSISIPLISVFWQDERIRVVRKKLKDLSTSGTDLIDKEVWENDNGRYFNKKVGFEKASIEITVSEGRVEIRLNDQKPIVYRDASIRKWPLENYFNAGNYLQTNNLGSFATVKFYALEVSH